MSDGPCNTWYLKNRFNLMLGDSNKNVGVEQRNLHLFLPVTPLSHDSLHGKEYIEAALMQQVTYLFFLAALCVEDKPRTFFDSQLVVINQR